MKSFFIVLGIAFFFYLFIPGIGAFLVRHKWRLFRKRIVEGSLYPKVVYSVLHGSEKGFLGNYRYFGNLQAIQGEHLLWLGDGKNTVCADLYKVEVFILPKGSYSDNVTDDMPKPIKWNRIFSLPEGTRFFIAGPLFIEGRNPVFRSTKELPLVVVLYDEDDSSLLSVSIWAARQKNEYWNFITPPSLAAGFLSLLIFSYSFLHNPEERLLALVTLTISLFPLIPLLPPGVALLFLYRYFWKEGRIYRAERDLVKLPLRYFSGNFTGREYQETILPDGSTYCALRIPSEKITTYLQKEDPPKVLNLSRAQGFRNSRETYVFGVNVGGEISKPEDPLADYIILPGNPVTLSKACKKRARKLEIFSGLAFILGFLLNLGIIVYILTLFIQ